MTDSDTQDFASPGGRAEDRAEGTGGGCGLLSSTKVVGFVSLYPSQRAVAWGKDHENRALDPAALGRTAEDG